jgi:hypothetical protein
LFPGGPGAGAFFRKHLLGVDPVFQGVHLREGKSGRARSEPCGSRCGPQNAGGTARALETKTGQKAGVGELVNQFGI